MDKGRSSDSDSKLPEQQQVALQAVSVEKSTHNKCKGAWTKQLFGRQGICML